MPFTYLGAFRGRYLSVMSVGQAAVLSRAALCYPPLAVPSSAQSELRIVVVVDALRRHWWCL